MKEKIKELLGLNIPNNVVATAVGVTDSYISQLLSDEEFAADVQKLRLMNIGESVKRDSKWNTLEDQFLEKLEALLPFGFSKPMEVLRALQVINTAKRRASPAELSATPTAQVVPLVLPVILTPKLVFNEQGQVIEVEGRTVATMPAKTVNEQLEKSRQDKNLTVERLKTEDTVRASEKVLRLQRLSAVMDVQPLTDTL